MYSETPDIIPWPASFRIDLLTEEQIETIKAGTLQLLEEVGVLIPSRRALEIFSEHGAEVDWETENVRIPPDLVLKAMSTAPRSFVLGGREERFDLLLDGNHSYLSTDGTGVHMVDLETREKRASCKADIELMARVCDALPMISFFWPPLSAQDYGRTAPLHQCHAGLTNTLKHVRGGMTVFPELVPFVVEMATVVTGSEEARRKRPPICCNICTIAPLMHDAHGTETALIYAEAGIPVSFMPMPTMGSTAPATPLGALVLGDAEAVSGMVLLQLAYPGTPVFHSIESSLMDPRTGGYIGGVALPMSWMAVQLAHAWNVPALGGGSVGSGAPDIGWYSGMEGGMGATTIPLYGGEICGFLGLLDGSMVLYPEQTILQNEMCQDTYDLFYGFEFNPADMALDIITKVGPRGHFLAQKHTRKHIRDFRLSKIVGQKDENGEERDPREAALEEFKRIADTHHPEPLPDDVLAELDRILEAAEREVEKIG